MAVRYPYRGWGSPEEYARRSLQINSDPSGLVEPTPARAEMARFLYSLQNSRRHVIEFRYPRARAYDNPEAGTHSHKHDPWWELNDPGIAPMQDGYFIPIPLTSDALFHVRSGSSELVGEDGSGNTFMRIDDLDVYEGFNWSPGGRPTWAFKEAITKSRISIRPLCHRTYIFRHVRYSGGEFYMRDGETQPHFILRHTRALAGEVAGGDEQHFEPWTWTDEPRPDWSASTPHSPGMHTEPGCNFIGGGDGDGQEWMASNKIPGNPLNAPFYEDYESELDAPPNAEIELVTGGTGIDTVNMVGLPWGAMADYVCRAWCKGYYIGDIDHFCDLVDEDREFVLIVNATHYNWKKYVFNGTKYDFELDIEDNVPLMLEEDDSGYAGAYGQVLAII